MKVSSALPSSSSSAKRKNATETEIWCSKCFDDPSIEICAFCGCKVCFGKTQPQLLILCDRCNRETHTFCLHPPLTAVPEEDPWYCESCAQQLNLSKISAGEDDFGKL
jgi:E3 ubiquitin-protein ligase UHRF1